MKAIPFFDPSIVIQVHSATNDDLIRLMSLMSIEEFSKGSAVALYEMENGDLRVVKQLKNDTQFIEGPEVVFG